MKKLGVLTICIAVLFGCSGSHTESATEDTVSAIGKDNNSLSQWINETMHDPEVLASLNAVSGANGQNAQFAGICSDKVVQAYLDSGNVKSVSHGGKDAAKGIEILEAIPESGATFTPAHLTEIKNLAQKISAANAGGEFTWNEADAKDLAKALQSSGFDYQSDSAAAKKALVAMLKGNDCSKILPRYCEYVQKKASDSSQTDLLRLDALLACDLTQWAGELRLNYPQNDYKFDRFRPYVSDEAIVTSRKQVFLEDMAKRGIEKAFAAIEPPDPQYRALIQSRKTYLDAIEAGGWPEVAAPSKLDEPKIGKSYAYVPALRKRLHAEGYDVGDLESDVMDQKLVDAISLYRDVHQLSDKKIVDNVLFKNIAVSPQARLEVIDLAIQKYRELAIGSLKYYVKVNIPDFYVEVWKDGQREARHRIVVGNNKVQIDPETKRQVPDPETLYPLHPNRTPIQTSKINEIIYQPYWNVPARIRIEELEPKLAENPNYYVENNYEEVNVGDPRLYYVRELPNPKNSLGKVKFMFPNPHNTYLHDTPAKAAFKNPVRALSHGCMRVQNPLDLAELLLKNDGQWDKAKVDGILNANPAEQVTIELNRPVDVDVVYVNARVDDSGVVAFLSDVYEYDAVRTGKVVLKKLPKPKGWK